MNPLPKTSLQSDPVVVGAPARPWLLAVIFGGSVLAMLYLRSTKPS